MLNVLFICTHNSARSVMAEALLNKLGTGRFQAYSAGSQPKAAPNRFALEKAAQLGFPADSYRSKSWDEFAKPGAATMDIIITVCDNAAGETCPFWAGHPANAHWGFPDPSAEMGSDEIKRAAFDRVFNKIKTHIEALVALPIETMDRATRNAALQKIAPHA